ncbi:MAG TPA: hypothetical protein VFI31_00895 [Pirellulales bacterium]|nr:hypothetical protein [Pirellulales bacterium]
MSGGQLAALRRLAEADADAGRAEQEAVQLAVNIKQLKDAGAGELDLRWLIDRHYARALEEDTPRGARERRFRAADGTPLSAATCFVITYGGRLFLESARRDGLNGARAAKNGALQRRLQWNPGARELRVDGRVARRYKRRAPVQWRVLELCEKARWRPPIIIYAAARNGKRAGRRLREIVSDLNEGLDHSLVVFHLNGDGALTFDVPAISR